MSVSSLNGYNAYNPLAAALAKSGASSSATSKVSSEAETIAKSSNTTDPKAARAALDKQIASDVQSGSITQDDADKITAALNQFETNMKSGGPRGGGRPSGPLPGGGAGGPPPGGGAGGASASSSKSALEELTELLETASDDEEDDDEDDSTSSIDLSSYLADLLKSNKVDFSA